ncbi:MAG: PEGA domain-containing protein [Deltaproteobacteria bacterium]|nr:PEGA domain-containing protein [Deltaproteobacteria bacterium]
MGDLGHMGRRALALSLVLFAPVSALASGGLDVEGWLARPGVKLLAVELYATWCKPCMDAVPRWKALHERYRAEGLRLVVVSTQDPGGACANPGWAPDEVVCDDDGAIARALGAGDKLPAAFLWSWQGHLLADRGTVEEVEAEVEGWLRTSPRVVVEVKGGAGGDELEGLLRTRLDDEGKLTVVASEAERARLAALARESYAPGADEKLACELGKDVSASSLLSASLAGARGTLHLSLLSVERKCLVASASAPYSADAARRSVGEALGALLAKLRTAVRFPGGSQAPAAKGEPEEQLLSRSPAWQPRAGARETLVELKSEPPGAIVLEGRTLLCQATPCTKRLPLGPHTLSMQRERYAEKTERVVVTHDSSSLSWALDPTFGWLTVKAPVDGLEVRLDGKLVGATPLVRREVDPGRYALEVSGPCHEPSGVKNLRVDPKTDRTFEATAEPRRSAIRVTATDEAGNDLEAAVLVDGREVGTSLGEPIPVQTCSKTVEVRKDGYPPWSGTLELRERQVTEVAARLRSSSGLNPARAREELSRAEDPVVKESAPWWPWVLAAACTVGGVGIDAGVDKNGALEAIDFVPVGLYVGAAVAVILGLTQ